MADFELRPPVYLPYLVRGFQAFRSETVNTTDEERRSYRPATAEAGEPLQVAFFGGSVTFGVGQRDEHTIPSEFARLAEEAGVAVEVHNYGFPGWVLWQEQLYLERLLAAGHRFDLVLFLDGFNEVHVQEEHFSTDPTHGGASTLSDLVAEFSEQHEHEPATFAGLGELRAAYARASGLARLVDALGGPDDGSSSGAGRSPEELADAALGIYERARLAAAEVAEEAGAGARFFWQPRRDGWPADVTARLDPEVVDLSAAFDGQAEDRYIDHVHTDEVGARVLAEAMWDEVAEDVEALR
jgi:lysophospholipase L1-like esterase